MKKSYALYKEVICSECLKRFDEIMQPFNNLGYEWEDIEDLKLRHKIKLTVKIGAWQKSLCHVCLNNLLKATKKDDQKELYTTAQKFHGKGVRVRK